MIFCLCKSAFSCKILIFNILKHWFLIVCTNVQLKSEEVMVMIVSNTEYIESNESVDNTCVYAVSDEVSWTGADTADTGGW